MGPSAAKRVETGKPSTRFRHDPRGWPRGHDPFHPVGRLGQVRDGPDRSREEVAGDDRERVEEDRDVLGTRVEPPAGGRAREVIVERGIHDDGVLDAEEGQEGTWHARLEHDRARPRTLAGQGKAARRAGTPGL